MRRCILCRRLTFELSGRRRYPGGCPLERRVSEVIGRARKSPECHSEKVLADQLLGGSDLRGVSVFSMLALGVLCQTVTHNDGFSRMALSQTGAPKRMMASHPTKAADVMARATEPARSRRAALLLLILSDSKSTPTITHPIGASAHMTKRILTRSSAEASNLSCAMAARIGSRPMGVATKRWMYQNGSNAAASTSAEGPARDANVVGAFMTPNV